MGDFDKRYLEDEVREGFYVPAMMKQCWAAQLEVLTALDCVCQKHQIAYFAEWGSLLGAVRHGGFIPWDDDLDIVMKRDDYEKFIRFSGELPKGFEVQTYRNREDYIQFITNVVGKSRICFEPEHYEKFHGFPYICGLDIFIIDYISPDIEEERKRDKEVLYVVAAADAIAEGKLENNAKEQEMRKVEQVTGEKIDRNLTGHALRARMYEIAERMMAKFRPSQASELSQLMPWGLRNENARVPKKYYEEMLRIPFEYTTIPVPTAYDDILKRRYGNYMKVVKAKAGHDYPCFRTQQESMKQTLLADAPEIAEKMIPEYRYEMRVKREVQGEEMARSAASSHERVFHGYRALLAEAISQMETLVDGIVEGNIDTVLQQLADAQQLAVDMGTLIETVRGEGFPCVHSLEQFCEKVYALYEAVQMVSDCGNANGQEVSKVAPLVDALMQVSATVKSAITSEILDRKVVVFLPYKAEYWDAMEPAWREKKSQADTDVLVVPIPYYYKDFYGRLIDRQYAPEQYPERLEVHSYENFPFELLHADEIYMQYPYDTYNSVTGILPEHQSDRLVLQTEKLCYVPWFSLAQFTEEDSSEYYNMKHYVLMPGVVNADEVLLAKQDAWMKPLYVQKLAEWAGEETRALWDEKIVIREGDGIAKHRSKFTDDKSLMDEALKSNEKKKILYYVGIGQFLEYEDAMMEKLRASFAVFADAGDAIEVLYAPDPTIARELPRLRPTLWATYDAYVKQQVAAGACTLIEPAGLKEAEKSCDAFYGDQGFVMRHMQIQGKPVMVQDVKLR